MVAILLLNERHHPFGRHAVVLRKGSVDAGCTEKDVTCDEFNG